MSPRDRTIRVDYLARVEGEGALHVRARKGRVEEVKLRIFEPPRFFEALLRGRGWTEAPDITSRICGICPVAYQMSAVHAMERIAGVAVDAPTRALRRLLYCGEWIESHALHVFMLHAPDFLGYPDAIHMARDHRRIVEMGLLLKKTGNEIMTRVAGREIHPVNVRVGGFHRFPSRRELAPLVERLEAARDAALEAVRWTARLPFPEFERDYHFVSLRHPEEYPMNEGRIVSNRGIDLDADAYETRFHEEQASHSNALHSAVDGDGTYLVGPLARYALCGDRLSPLAREAARDAGLGPVCRNPFRSIVVRAVELLYAADEALRILSVYEPPDAPAGPPAPREGTGCAATEAPRGLLYHRYRIDGEGTIVEAKIVPPTSQNQREIEADLRGVVERNMQLPKRELARRCEQTIRNYDPCISCATHFLDFDLREEDA